MFCEAVPGSCFDRIKDRLVLDFGKIPVTKQFQVGRVGVYVNAAAQDCDGTGHLLKSLATVRIFPYDIAHKWGG